MSDLTNASSVFLDDVLFASLMKACLSYAEFLEDNHTDVPRLVLFWNLYRQFTSLADMGHADLDALMCTQHVFACGSLSCELPHGFQAFLDPHAPSVEMLLGDATSFALTEDELALLFFVVDHALRQSLCELRGVMPAHSGGPTFAFEPYQFDSLLVDDLLRSAFRKLCADIGLQVGFESLESYGPSILSMRSGVVPDPLFPVS